MIKNILKSVLTIKPKDAELIRAIKRNYIHETRGFDYKYFRLATDSIKCEASPGVFETVLVELNKHNLQGKKLLNLGGGTGQVSDIFKTLGLEVYNLDIEVVEENQHNLKFDLNENKPLPFENEYFDFIICQEIIEHIENPWKLFRDAKKVLKRNGLFFLSTPNLLSRLNRFYFFFTGYFKWFTPDCFSFHINPLPLWEIKLIAQKTGFDLVNLKGNGDYYFNRSNKSEKSVINDNEQLIMQFTKK